MKFKEINKEEKQKSEDYSEYLKRKGHKWPIHESSYTYIDINGRTRDIPYEKPYILAIYEPQKREYRFPKYELAVDIIKNVDPLHWQIINIISGEVIKDASSS